MFIPAISGMPSIALGPSTRSVVSLERKVRTANDASQLRLLSGKLEPRGKLGWDFHAFRELEPRRPASGVINGVHHIDRETTRVEHVCHPNVLDLEGCRFERATRDNDVALLLEDTFHPRDCVLDLAAGSTVKTWLYLVLK